MLVSRNSRHHRRGWQADSLDQFTRVLRRLADIASGRHHWGGSKGRHHRHGASGSRSYKRRDASGRRQWLVRREISLWRLSIVVCTLLVFLWIGWSIVAHTAAVSLSRSDPEAALGFVANQRVALNQLAQKELRE